MTFSNKILFFLFIFIIVIANSSFSATSADGFENWLLSYKKFASKKGVSQETLNIAFKDVKFLDQVIKYDRKQPEFIEDTITYVNKRANSLRTKNAKKLLLKNKNLLVTGGSKGIGFSTLISLYNDIYREKF